MSVLFSFAGGLGEQPLVSSENATSTNRSNKAVKKGKWYPTQTFGYLLFTFLSPVKPHFVLCTCVCLRA